MKTSTSHTKDVTIPLLLVVAGIVLTVLTPNSETLEKFLNSYLKHKSLVLVVKASIGAIVCLLPYWVYQKCVHTSPQITSETQDELFELIRANTSAKYDLHVPERESQIRSMIADCAARGEPRPDGTVLGEVIDLYKKELQVFYHMLSSTINDVMASDNYRMPTTPLVSLVHEIVSQKTKELGALCIEFIDNHFASLDQNNNTSLKKDVCADLDKDSELIIAQISTGLKIKEKL